MIWKENQASFFFLESMSAIIGLEPEIAQIQLTSGSLFLGDSFLGDQSKDISSKFCEYFRCNYQKNKYGDV